MDDQQTYLLNGLLTRQFHLGRIVRFRQLPRGRQAATYEFLTSEQNEYLVQLYPPSYSPDQLQFVATTLNALDANRFSVLPTLPKQAGGFVAEGLQGTHMLLSLGAAGAALAPSQYTAHDISQIGLRLAWMHRLLKEQIPTPPDLPKLKTRLENLFAHPTPESARAIPAIPPALRDMLFSILEIPIPIDPGWAHGDFQVAALLHDADHQLRTIVDWGLLHFGSPLEDVVDAFVSICISPDGTYRPDRSRILRESYDSLIPLQQLPWTPVVGTVVRPAPPGRLARFASAAQKFQRHPRRPRKTRRRPRRRPVIALRIFFGEHRCAMPSGRGPPGHGIFCAARKHSQTPLLTSPAAPRSGTQSPAPPPPHPPIPPSSPLCSPDPPEPPATPPAAQSSPPYTATTSAAAPAQ